MDVEGIREGGCIPPVNEAGDEEKKVGSYTLIREIGKGEKAKVYLARDPFGREVAIKAFFTYSELMTIPEEYRHYFFDEQGVAKLAQKEWEIGQILKHPHIAEVIDFFTERREGSTYSYIVMEYLEADKRETLSKTGALCAALGLLDALSFSFSKGFIHRDLYSDNMILNTDGVLKLIDIDSFELIKESCSDIGEVDDDGGLMDPLDCYLRGINIGVSRYLSMAGLDWDVGTLIPADTHRNIQNEDIPLILKFIESIREKLHSIEGARLFMPDGAALNAHY